jgi:MSHA biogenesis protein MshJ
MNARLQQFEDWVNALSVRERLLVIIGVIAVVFLLWDKVLLSPLEVKAKQLEDGVKRQQQNLEKVRVQQQQILDRAGKDPNKGILKQIDAINEAIEELDETLRGMTVDLIDPQQMAIVLEEVLTRRTDLKLVRVEALPPESLGQQILDDASEATQQDTATNADIAADVVPGVYKHTLEIEFVGSYLSTLDYMKELESLQRRFYWGSVNFEVKEYPNAQVVIRVNTLSLNDAWIGV